MKRHRHTPEQVVRKLREGERLLNDGKDLVEVLRHLEISEATWNRWRNQYGGMKADGARRLRELETENARLKKLLAEAELDKAMLKELPRETSDPGPPSPRRGPVAAAVRGVSAAGLPGGGAAPLDPADGGQAADRPGAAVAPTATHDRTGASAVGVADGAPAAAP